MIGNQTHNQSNALKEFSISENQTVHSILFFIKNTLPEFELIFKESKIEIQNEDEISKELSRFFNDKAREQNLFFQFNEKKGVDFTIYVIPYKMGVPSIFMIEAKRLSKKHRDYVSGRTGGIKRIKREQDEFGEHLNSGAMIGYVQDENQEYWRNKINVWIDDLISQETDIIWQEEDKLIEEGKLSDFISFHLRKTKPPITIFHYWINLN